MNATVCFTRNYENQPLRSLAQNKPNQTQFVKSQEMNATTFLTKDYANQPPWGSKSNSHEGQNELQLLFRKRLMKIIPKTAKFADPAYAGYLAACALLSKLAAIQIGSLLSKMPDSLSKTCKHLPIRKRHRYREVICVSPDNYAGASQRPFCLWSGLAMPELTNNL